MAADMLCDWLCGAALSGMCRGKKKRCRPGEGPVNDARSHQDMTELRWCSERREGGGLWGTNSV